MIKRNPIWLLLSIWCWIACQQPANEKSLQEPVANSVVVALPDTMIEVVAEGISQLEQRMIEMGLVDVQMLDSNIVVDLKYAGTDNFFGQNVYGDLRKAYLQPEVAHMLVRAQGLLRDIDPELNIMVYDAARPRSVQQIMWDAVDAPFEEKIRFLSNPRNGSVHNFGAAVDVGLVDIYGVILDMGTEFDHMGTLAWPSMEEEMLRQGQLDIYEVENRRLLRQVMQKAGFRSIATEWWHFNAMSRDQARERYTIIE